MVRIGPEAGSELFERDDDLVIQALAVQKGASLFEDAHDLKGTLADGDFLAHGRLAREQIRGDLEANDTDRAATLNFGRGKKPALRKRDTAGQEKLFGRADDFDSIGAQLLVLDRPAREGCGRD